MEIILLKKSCLTGYGEVKIIAEYLVDHDENKYKATCQVVGIESCRPEIMVESVGLPAVGFQNHTTLTEAEIMMLIQDEIDDMF